MAHLTLFGKGSGVSARACRVRKRKAFIFDIDGTLALLGDRHPYDWERVGEDRANDPVARCLRAICSHGYTVLLFSGRDEACRRETEQWLKHHGVSYSRLLMRPERNNEDDCIVKKQMLAEVRGKYDVVGVFDDRKRVKRMWVGEGVFVFDVNQRDEEF